MSCMQICILFCFNLDFKIVTSEQVTGYKNIAQNHKVTLLVFNVCKPMLLSIFTFDGGSVMAFNVRKNRNYKYNSDTQLVNTTVLKEKWDRFETHRQRLYYRFGRRVSLERCRDKCLALPGFGMATFRTEEEFRYLNTCGSTLIIGAVFTARWRESCAQFFSSNLYIFSLFPFRHLNVISQVTNRTRLTNLKLTCMK